MLATLFGWYVSHHKCYVVSYLKRLYPGNVTSKIGDIINVKRELPGHGGEMWSHISADMRGSYFDELRVS